MWMAVKINWLGRFFFSFKKNMLKVKEDLDRFLMKDIRNMSAFGAKSSTFLIPFVFIFRF